MSQVAEDLRTLANPTAGGVEAKRSPDLDRSPMGDRLARALDEISKDAHDRPSSYVEGSVVPEGGE